MPRRPERGSAPRGPWGAREHRPARPAESFIVMIVGALLIVSVGFTIFSLTGTAVSARVLSCTGGSGPSTPAPSASAGTLAATSGCTASWTVHGRTVTGKVEGAKAGDVGTTLSARVHGNTAYVRPTTRYLVLDAILVVVAIGVVVWWRQSRRRRRAGDPGDPADPAYPADPADRPDSVEP